MHRSTPITHIMRTNHAPTRQLRIAIMRTLRTATCRQQGDSKADCKAFCCARRSASPAQMIVPAPTLPLLLEILAVRPTTTLTVSTVHHERTPPRRHRNRPSRGCGGKRPCAQSAGARRTLPGLFSEFVDVVLSDACAVTPALLARRCAFPVRVLVFSPGIGLDRSLNCGIGCARSGQCGLAWNRPGVPLGIRRIPWLAGPARATVDRQQRGDCPRRWLAPMHARLLRRRRREGAAPVAPPAASSPQVKPSQGSNQQRAPAHAHQ